VAPDRLLLLDTKSEEEERHRAESADLGIGDVLGGRAGERRINFPTTKRRAGTRGAKSDCYHDEMSSSLTHHEPFCPEATEWSFQSDGPLSGANGALPWIVFKRDRTQFESEFPELAIKRVQPFLPFRYLVSGGVSMRTLMPGFMHSFWLGVERLLASQMERIGMFALIVLRKA
jgi:hypothetical protein